MKLLGLSDAHSNIRSLQAVEKAETAFDRVFFLGDMVDYGFHPCEVIRWMRQHEAVAVLGNHDRHLLNLADEGMERLERPMEAAAFALNNLSQMGEEELAYLRGLPEERVERADGIEYYMAHAYDLKDDQALLRSLQEYNSAAFFEQVWAHRAVPLGASPSGLRRLVYGHTHQCIAYHVRTGAMALNPGSLSYRLGREGGPCKGGDYLVIEDGDVRLRHVDYDTRDLYEMVEHSGLQGNERRVGLGFYSPEQW